MERIFVYLLSVCLALPVLAETKASGRAMLDGERVSWGTVSTKIARSVGVNPPLSLILFTFPVKVGSSRVSDAQWEKEAKRQGTDVGTIKMILGPSVYVTKSGDLASCTMIVISKGLCGKVRIMSVEKRVEAARSILEQSGKCKWIDFDPGLNTTMSRQAGAEDATLWVAADCRK